MWSGASVVPPSLRAHPPPSSRHTSPPSQVLLYSVTDAFARGEEDFSSQNLENTLHTGWNAAHLQASLTHVVTIGVPVLDMQWRPVGVGEGPDTCRPLLAVVGASDAVALVDATTGTVSIPYTAPAGCGPLHSVAWLPHDATQWHDTKRTHMASLDELGGQPFRCGLAVVGYGKPALVHGCEHLELDTTSWGEAAGEAEGGATGGAEPVELESLYDMGEAINTARGAHGLLYVMGQSVGWRVLALDGTDATAPVAFKRVDGMKSTLELSSFILAPNPQRVGSLSYTGVEGRTAVSHVGPPRSPATQRQVYAYKCHRSQQDRSQAMTPTVLEWWSAPEAHEVARCMGRRKYTFLDQLPFLEWPGDDTHFTRSGQLFTQAATVPSSVEETAPLDDAEVGAFGHVPPTVMHRLAWMGRYVRSATQARERLCTGQLCMSASGQGELTFWDVDNRQRCANMQLKDGEGESPPITALAMDASNTMLAIATGRSWHAGKPEAKEKYTAAGLFGASLGDAGEATGSQRTRLLLWPVVAPMSSSR